MDKSSIRRKIQHLKKKLKRSRTPTSSDSSSNRSPSPKRRRIRAISSDSSEPGPDDENTCVATNGQANDVVTDTDIHSHLAVRWNHILSKGLKKEHRNDFLKQYIPPANCNFLEAPKLNEEIKAAVQESSLKRDEKLAMKQSQLGAGITCLGRALEIAFKIPDKQSRDQIVKYLGDGGQILCDQHYLDTITRRSLLAQGLNKNTKEATKNLTRDKLLFGEGLSETLKALKACSRSATDIKTKSVKPVQRSYDSVAGPSTHKTTSNPSLNWRGPPRRPAYPAMTAGAYRERRQPAAAPARRMPYSRNTRPLPPSSTKKY